MGPYQYVFRGLDPYQYASAELDGSPAEGGAELGQDFALFATSR